MQVFEIDSRHQEAAQLLANGELTDADIAAKVGISRQTLWLWKQREEFTALVDDHLARFREEVRRRGLANPDRRIKALNDRWNRLQRVIEARADHLDYADAPGGTTGLLVKTTKMLGSGDNARIVDEFVVDTGLLREVREHEKQAAQELGQWVDRQQVDQKVNGRLDVASALATLPSHELDTLENIAEKLAGGPDPAPDGGPGGEVPA